MRKSSIERVPRKPPRALRPGVLRLPRLRSEKDPKRVHAGVAISRVDLRRHFPLGRSLLSGRRLNLAAFLGRISFQRAIASRSAATTPSASASCPSPATASLTTRARWTTPSTGSRGAPPRWTPAGLTRTATATGGTAARAATLRRPRRLTTQVRVDTWRAIQLDFLNRPKLPYYEGKGYKVKSPRKEQAILE